MQGNYTVMQQIEVTDPQQVLHLSPDGVNTVQVTAADLSVDTYLAVTDGKYAINIDNYTPCAACTPLQPDCRSGESAAQTSQLDFLLSADRPLYNDIRFPTKLMRMRFCNGEEHYLFQAEAAALYGPYVLLQETELPTAGTTLSITKSDGSTVTVNNPLDIFGMRLKNPGISINGYEPCGKQTDDSDGKQEQSVAALLLQLGQTDPSAIKLPAKLNRVVLPNKRELNLFDEELPALAGDYYIRSKTELTHLDEMMRVSVNGDVYTDKTVREIIAARAYTSVTEFKTTEEEHETENGELGNYRLSFYFNDHLGNTRIVYRVKPATDDGPVVSDENTPANCDKAAYVIEYMADYYPYGKVLREYVCSEAERYLTTQHERNRERSGLSGSKVL